jgi:hypothetical protein
LGGVGSGEARTLRFSHRTLCFIEREYDPWAK